MKKKFSKTYTRARAAAPPVFFFLSAAPTRRAAAAARVINHTRTGGGRGEEDDGGKKKKDGATRRRRARHATGECRRDDRSSASASRKPERRARRRAAPPHTRGVCVACVRAATDSQPTRPRSRATGGRERDVRRRRRRRPPRDCFPSQLERTTARRARLSNARRRDARPPVEDERARRRGETRDDARRSNRQSLAGAARAPGTEAPRRARAARSRRSGRVSGIRPSDRRGPGPVGHRGRNVRSTGRCSYNLRITRGRADSCGLHRSTSQVIRRSGSGVCVCFIHFYT